MFISELFDETAPPPRRMKEGVNDPERYHFLYPHVPLDQHTDHEYNNLSDKDLKATRAHQAELKKTNPMQALVNDLHAEDEYKANMRRRDAASSSSSDNTQDPNWDPYSPYSANSIYKHSPTSESSINEFADSAQVKVGEPAHHGLIGNVNVLRIKGNIAEISDLHSGKHFKVQLSSLMPGERTDVDEAVDRVPTAKQVEAAKAKYDMFGLKIENAKKKAGYARGTGIVGDLQRKKGDAYQKYIDLKRAFDSANKTSQIANEGASFTIDQDDLDEFGPENCERIRNSHFPDTLRSNLRMKRRQDKQQAERGSLGGGESSLIGPTGGSSGNDY